MVTVCVKKVVIGRERIGWKYGLPVLHVNSKFQEGCQCSWILFQPLHFMNFSLVTLLYFTLFWQPLYRWMEFLWSGRLFSLYFIFFLYVSCQMFCIFHVVNFTLSMWGSGCTWYLDSNGQDPFISEFLNSLYDCPYGSFLHCAFREQTSCLSCYLYSYLEVVLLFTIDISFQLIFSMLL